MLKSVLTLILFSTLSFAEDTSTTLYYDNERYYPLGCDASSCRVEYIRYRVDNAILKLKIKDQQEIPLVDCNRVRCKISKVTYNHSAKETKIYSYYIFKGDFEQK